MSQPIAMEPKYVFNTETKELATGGQLFQCSPGGVGFKLFENIKKFAGQGLIAQIEAHTETKDTYHDCLARCIKLSVYLRKEGIREGDVIAMCSKNNLDNSVVLFAALFTGAVIASTDPNLSLIDTKYLLNLIEPKIVFFCEDSEQLIRSSVEALAVDSRLIALFPHASNENFATIMELITKEEVDAFKPTYIDATDSTAVIMFSSGTTGMPKGICLTYDSLESNLGQNLQPGLVVAGFTTHYWLSSVMFAIVSGYYGLCFLRNKQFNAKTLWEDVKRFKVNMLYLSYSHCMDGLQYLEGPIQGLIGLMIVGGAIPPQQFDEYESKLINTKVFINYAQTETGGVSGRITDNFKKGSAGQPFLKDQVIKIVDPDTEQALDLNQTGEIRVKYKYQMKGYYKQDSSNCWDANGFLKTGDLGYLDDEYNLFVVDRIKEMFKYRSWHVVPAKIENVLKEHAAVLHATVIGIPMEDNENHAMGIVVLKEGTVSATPEELTKFANERLDETHQLRKGVEIISQEELPYTATGKIDRRKLKGRFSK